MKSVPKKISITLLLLCSVAAQPLCAGGLFSSFTDSTEESSSDNKKLLIGIGAAVLVGLGIYWWKTATPAQAPADSGQPTKPEALNPVGSKPQEIVPEQPDAPASAQLQEIPAEAQQPTASKAAHLEPVSSPDEVQLPPEVEATIASSLENSWIEIQEALQPLLNNQPLVIDKQKIQNCFESPLHTYCTATQTEMLNYIRHGKFVVQEVCAGRMIVDPTLFDLSSGNHDYRNMCLHNMVSACWYLYAIAASKDQAFDEGSFIVHDNGALYTYLLHYVQQVNPDWNSCVSQSSNPYGYCRHSTHLKDCQRNGNHHYGIDIRFGDSINWWEYWIPAAKQQQAVLPAGKKHILFGRIDDQRTFIKMENDGLYRYDGWGAHAAGAIGSVARKFGLGSNDLDTYRKEHMPTEINRELKALIKEHNLPLQTPTTIGQIIAAAPVHVQLNEFATRLRQKYDHIEGRFGNEVIIPAHELQTPLPDNFV